MGRTITHDPVGLARADLLLRDAGAQVGDQRIARDQHRAALALEHGLEVASAHRPQLEQAADQLRALAVKRDRRVDDRAQAVERMVVAAHLGEHVRGERLVHLVEHGLEHRAEVGKVEVQGRALDAERVGELAHARVDAPRPQHVERRMGELGSSSEVGPSGHEDHVAIS